MSGDDERWPNEPPDPASEEFDPLEDIGPDVPEVDIPAPPDPSENDVPADLARDFWTLVATFNIAIFAIALGPMLIVFRGNLLKGTIVFGLGLSLFGYGYWRYGKVKRRHSTDTDGDAETTGDDGPETTPESDDATTTNGTPDQNR